jgi:hypothetical protein
VAITLVQTGSGAAISWTNVAGNLLVAAYRGPSTITLQDGVNTWVQAVAINNGSNGMAIWYAANCAAGLRSLTHSAGGAGQMVSLEYSGLALSGVLAQTNSAKGASVAYASGSVTTTSLNTLIIGANSNETANSLTDHPTGGFTDRVSSTGNVFAADQIASSLGTFSYGGGWGGLSETWAAAVAVFIAASSGRNRTLLGVGT